MPLERTLQVRVSRVMERDLRQDAASLGLSESEALRHALALLHRVAQRQRNAPHLIEQARLRGTPDDQITGFE